MNMKKRLLVSAIAGSLLAVSPYVVAGNSEKIDSRVGPLEFDGGYPLSKLLRN